MAWIGTVLWWRRMLPPARKHASRFGRYVERSWRPWLNSTVGRLPRMWRGAVMIVAALPLLLLGFAGVGFWYFVAAAARVEGDLTKLSLVPDIYMVVYTIYLVIGISVTVIGTAEEGLGSGLAGAAMCSLPAWALVLLMVVIELLRVVLGFLLSFGGHWPQFDLPTGTVIMLSVAPFVTFWISGWALYAGGVLVRSANRLPR